MKTWCIRLAGALALSVSAMAAQAVEITFYHYQQASLPALCAILDDFQAANPDITVKDVFKPSKTITADVQAALAAGRDVDVATVIGKNIIFFLNNTPAVPLNSDGDSAWLDGYLPNLLDLGRVGEKIFAIPHAYGTPMIYYNKDIFREAGLDPETPPKTWDEVVAVARQIKARTGKAAVAHLQASMGDYGTMVMVTNAGSTYLTKDGTQAKFDDANGIAVLQMWQDLAKDGLMPVAEDTQWTSAFMAGQMGIYITSSAALRTFADKTKGKFELGVGNYPLWKDQPRRVNNSGAALMLYAPEGERRVAALKLLKYLSRQEVSNRWSRETGYMPVIANPEADPAMKAYIESFPLVRPTIDQMAETVPTATWPAQGTLEAQTTVRAMLDELWAGNRPASEIVPEAVARINGFLAPNRASN
ncbi:MAG: ABC transporter substrate-binding protein [Pseudomonadota bacterium]|nr:ABC transporter substrate-binding protein [Pseudomonadota bacterium]